MAKTLPAEPTHPQPLIGMVSPRCDEESELCTLMHLVSRARSVHSFCIDTQVRPSRCPTVENYLRRYVRMHEPSDWGRFQSDVEPGFSNEGFLWNLGL